MISAKYLRKAGYTLRYSYLNLVANVYGITTANNRRGIQMKKQLIYAAGQEH